MKTITLLTLALIIAAGCKSELDGKAPAQVTEPSATTAPAEPETAKADAKLAVVPFDLTSSKIEWVAGKVTKDHTGGFKTFTGNVTYGADGTVSAIETEIDTTSVYSDVEKLTKHLKGPDFFDVEKFPKSTFKTSKIVKKAGDTYVVTGLLDLHGVQKEIAFEATIKADGPNTVANAEFTLKRFDFGIEYKGKADDLVKPTVLMKLTVVAPTPAKS